MQSPAVADFYPPETESEMALNSTDKAWITLEIQTALKRKGWGKLTGFIKDWSGAGAAAGILIFMLSQWGNYVEFRTQTNLRLTSIEGKLETINKQLASNTASLALLNPHASNTLPQAIKDNLSVQKNNGLGLRTVAALAMQAKELNLQADPKQIGAVGGQLTSSPELLKPKNNGDAWDALTGLLSYYTTLNAIPMGLSPVPFGAPRYDLGYTEGKTVQGELLYTGGMVPIDQAAIGEHIVNPERNADIKEAPQTIVFKAKSQDEAVHLDRHHLRNVVIINMTIYYDGGPVILDNVTFINCIFKLAQQEKCVSFGRSLFASNPITFKTTG